MAEAAAFLPRAWAGAFGALGLLALLSVLPVLAPGLGAGWAGAGLAVITLVSGLVAWSSCLKLSIGGSAAEARRRFGLGPAGLQLGWGEARLIASILLVSLFLTLILTVLLLVVVGVFGASGFDVAGTRLTAEGLPQPQAAEGAAVPPWRLWLASAVAIGALLILLRLKVPLMLAQPATVGRGHIVSLNALALGEGNFLRLLAGLILALAPVWALAGLIALMPQLPWVLLVPLVVAAVQLPLLAGLLGAAYRQLEYWTPEGGAG